MKGTREWIPSLAAGRSATYSEGERQLPIGLAGRVQVDVLPLSALVVRALALRGERRDTNPGVRERRGAQRGADRCRVRRVARGRNETAAEAEVSVWVFFQLVTPGGTGVHFALER